MRITRVHTRGPLVDGAPFALEPRAATHLVRVLRLQEGDRLTVFDGAGREYAATIASIRAERVEVRLGAAQPALPESPLEITLAQGISRGDRMDYAIQKATELGVARIAPLLCERSVVKLDAEQALRKLEHWRGIAIAACEQCGRATVPEINAPRRYADYLSLGATAGVRRLVLAPQAVQSLGGLATTLERVELLIGPEGGLSDEELRLATLTGYEALRLGPRVLRTETAAAAAIAALQTLYGDLG